MFLQATPHWYRSICLFWWATPNLYRSIWFFLRAAPNLYRSIWFLRVTPNLYRSIWFSLRTAPNLYGSIWFFWWQPQTCIDLYGFASVQPQTYIDPGGQTCGGNRGRVYKSRRHIARGKPTSAVLCLYPCHPSQKNNMKLVGRVDTMHSDSETHSQIYLCRVVYARILKPLKPSLASAPASQLRSHAEPWHKQWLQSQERNEPHKAPQVPKDRELLERACKAGHECSLAALRLRVPLVLMRMVSAIFHTWQGAVMSRCTPLSYNWGLGSVQRLMHKLSVLLLRQLAQDTSQANIHAACPRSCKLAHVARLGCACGRAQLPPCAPAEPRQSCIILIAMTSPVLDSEQ